MLTDRFGVRPRAGFADPSPELLNISRYDETGAVLNTFVYSYKFHTDKGTPARHTTLILEREGKPYILDDWTGAAPKLPAGGLVTATPMSRSRWRQAKPCARPSI